MRPAAPILVLKHAFEGRLNVLCFGHGVGDLKSGYTLDCSSSDHGVTPSTVARGLRVVPRTNAKTPDS